MTTYYVATTGNDNNAGTSGSPFATITHAATRCVAGDTVLVNDGTYSLSQATYVNGAAGSPITYKAVNKGQAKIVGTTDDPWYNQGNYVVIDGFDITNGVTNGVHGINNYGSNVTIQNCTIHDILLTSCPSVGGAAIFDGGYNSGEQVNVNILNNTIYNIGPVTTCTIVHGIYQTCSGGIIANNIIYGVCGYGIHLWHAATDQVIANNLIFAGRYGGLLVGNDGTNAWATSNNNTIVANNIFYSNTNYGFREFGNTGTNNRYINNAVFGSSTPTSILTGRTPIGTITADPAFVNYQANGSGDYHLSSTSPCIGTGSPVGAYATDRDGNARPTRPFRYDIGPYVYLQTIGVLPGDANLQRALGVYDPTSHKVVAVQAGTTSTDGTTGVVFAPLSSSGGSSSNASVGTTGSAIPASSTLLGASDGTNLQQLLVESATNKNLRMAFYNGTNEALVDASGNQYIRGNFTEMAGLSAGSLNADLVPSTDVSAYKWFSLQVTGTWSGTLTFQGSNDNTNFVSLYVYQINNITNFTFSYTANGLYAAAITCRYLRVRMTIYASGTANGVLELYTQPPAFSPAIYSSQSGTWNTGLLASTTGGTGDFHLISAATTNATSIKGSAGQVYGYELYNSNAAVRYVKLYNKNTAPTVGADTPFRTIGVPANGRASFQTSIGLLMGSGIAIATTTGIADGDSTAVGAGDLSIDVDWK